MVPTPTSSLIMDNVILGDIMDDTPRALAWFHSAMRQVLWTIKLLSMHFLSLMCCSFPDKTERYGIEIILRSMVSLFSGITDISIPVRPLHSSFYDFLIDKAQSERFHIDPLDIHLNLAFALLHIMQDGLPFNMCQLQTSYTCNSEVADLNERISRIICCIPVDTGMVT